MTPGQHSRIDEVIRRVRGGMRTWSAIRGTSLVTLALFAAVAVSFTTDFGLRLDRLSRGIVGLLLLGAIVVVARRVLMRPLRTPLSDDDVALVLERRFPRLDETLVSAVQFRRQRERDGDGVSGELMDLVEGRAEESVSGLTLVRIFDRATVGRLALAAGSVLLAAVALAVVFPDHAGLWFRRAVLLSSDPWPRRTTLVVEGFSDGVLRVPRGETVAVHVRAEGEVPRRVEVEFEYDDGVEGEAVLSDLTGGRFRHVFRDLVEPVTFRFSGGDGETGPLRIVVAERPAAESMQLHLTYPAYLGLEPAVHDVFSGGLSVPEGTSIEIRARTRGPVAVARLAFGETTLETRLETPRDVHASLVPETGGLLSLDLVDEEGFESRPAATVTIRVEPDAPPRATLRAIEVGPAVTPEAVLPLKVTLHDDHGLSGADLARSVIGMGENLSDPLENVEPLPGVEVAGREIDTMLRVEVSEIGVEPGAILRLQVKVRDDDGLHGPKQADSEPLTFRVVSRDDLLAEMIRRQQEIRRDLERVAERVREDRDDLAKLEASLRAQPPLDEAVRSVTEIARGQRRSGRRVVDLAERFDRVLAEMRNNRLVSDAETAALSAAVPQPMRRLATGLFPESARLTDLAARQEEPAKRVEAHGAAVRTYDGVIRGLDRILEAMSRAEGFTELVERLRQIVRLESEVRAATEEEYRRRIRDLFPEDEREDR